MSEKWRLKALKLKRLPPKLGLIIGGRWRIALAFQEKSTGTMVQIKQ
jgi:hypothetical protein